MKKVLSKTYRKLNNKLYFLKKDFWKKGNRDTGYKIGHILRVHVSDLFYTDILVSKYPEGSRQLPHKDTIENHNLYRISLTLKPAVLGGKVRLLEDGPAKQFGPLTIMRPDRVKHEVTEIKKGNRYSLLVTFFVKDFR